ncbi:hypothetical protein SAMN04515648_4510 [Phyllobacterium sp. CL33Tsu]|nr:hypothetical protein SAMN04515648_4510 [Phyllobacterium sp. CL33Tsu]
MMYGQRFKGWLADFTFIAGPLVVVGLVVLAIFVRCVS